VILSKRTESYRRASGVVAINVVFRAKPAVLVLAAAYSNVVSEVNAVVWNAATLQAQNASVENAFQLLPHYGKLI